MRENNTRRDEMKYTLEIYCDFTGWKKVGDFKTRKDAESAITAPATANYRIVAS